MHDFKVGDSKMFSQKVSEKDIATFDTGNVHPVLSTFALGRNAEWVCRLFVLEMKEDDEEGIGTFLEIKHHNPAFVEEEVNYISFLDEIEGISVICSFEAKVGDRLIATGRTGQKILKKEKINRIFNSISGEGK